MASAKLQTGIHWFIKINIWAETLQALTPQNFNTIIISIIISNVQKTACSLYVCVKKYVSNAK